MEIERARKAYHYQSAAIDLSEASATLDNLIFIPRAGTLLRAAMIFIEATDGSVDTMAVKVGYANADGGSDDVDAYVLGTTDQANGLISASQAVGTVQELTLASTALTAGKMITISHVTDEAEAGTVYVILEYEF